MNEEFVNFLLNRVESAEEICSVADEIASFRMAHIRPVISLNLHLVCPENPVINCLSEGISTGAVLKSFAEELLILANKNGSEKVAANFPYFLLI